MPLIDIKIIVQKRLFHQKLSRFIGTCTVDLKKITDPFWDECANVDEGASFRYLSASVVNSSWRLLCRNKPSSPDLTIPRRLSVW